MSEIRSIPEVVGLDSCTGVVRVAPELDVPVTDRVRRLIDTEAFRRLARIPQLGLVSLVYPSATHSRFEHSLGVYRLALLFVRHLSHDDRFAAAVGRHEAELLLVAALLHDLGHWPFCHPIEDMRLDGVPHHEAFVERHLRAPELAALLREDWGISPEEVVAVLEGPRTSVALQILASMLSGPIDIDKLDYLQRDSTHSGVPYGRNFDQARLIGSLCLNERGDGLAITDKGKTAAEMMVFARYVMFSEVYWHHGVRSATAMLQRAFFELRERLDLDVLFTGAQDEMVAALREAGRGSPAGELLEGLFGARRALHKRLAEYSFHEAREVYERIARRPYAWLVDCGSELARRLGERTGRGIGAHEILIDAPPVEKEVEFKIDVLQRKQGRYRPLEEVSPVVRTLAKEQFDDHVKRVRVFASRAHAEVLAGLADLARHLVEAAEAVDARALESTRGD